MAEPEIELRKIRDFGQNISDTFLFIRQHVGPLVKSFLAICLIFILGTSVLNGFYQSRFVGIFERLLGGITRPGREYSLILNSHVLSLAGLTVFSFAITMVAMQVAVGAYMKFYLQYRQRPTLEEVWALFRRYYIRALLYNIVANIVIVLGTLCCVVPGIFLAVMLAPFTMVVMIEDKDMGEAFGRCNELIKNNFLSSIGIYIVGYIIYRISGWVVGIAFSIIGGIAAYLSTSDLGTTIGVGYSFASTFLLVFYLFYCVCVSLNYFSLVEIKDGTGLLGRINEFGTHPERSSFDDQY